MRFRGVAAKLVGSLVLGAAVRARAEGVVVDGQVELGEECDGASLGGLGCSDFCFDSGTLRCNGDCTLDTSRCFVCGDGRICGCNPGDVACGHDLGQFPGCCEVCDGTNLVLVPNAAQSLTVRAVYGVNPPSDASARPHFVLSFAEEADDTQLRAAWVRDRLSDDVHNDSILRTKRMKPGRLAPILWGVLCPDEAAARRGNPGRALQSW
jgi:hypothetical protein